MTSSVNHRPPTADQLADIDTQLSKRHIPLDPAGYFIIFLDREAGLIYAKHYGMTVNERGLAIDPKTGKPLSAKGKLDSELLRTYSGRTAKEICIAMFEAEDTAPVTHYDHAAYLGREFQRAEAALISGTDYIQD